MKPGGFIVKHVLFFVAVVAATLHLHADPYDDGTFVWSYSENGDGSVNIVDAVPSDGQNVPALVTIPAMIDGKKVRLVDNFLYGRDDYKTNIHTLIISYGIEQLRPFVFHGCVSLETVTIEADLLDYEGHNASPFADCPIKRVVFGEKATRVPRWMFDECDTLESFFFTGDMKEVGDVALYGCTVLSNVIVKGNADAFHISAFRGSPFYASIMESDALFELAIHKDVLLGYKHCTKIILPEDQPSTIVGARKTYEIIVPEGVKYIADRALSIATGNSGNGGWGWTVDFSKITLPEGLETIGSNAFGYQSHSTDGVEHLLTIPSSVRRIGSNLFTQTFEGTILFLGAKPEAEADSFVAAHAEHYGCDLSKTTVAYVEGTPGWKYGERWCGVLTYPVGDPKSNVRVPIGGTVKSSYYDNVGAYTYFKYKSEEIGLSPGIDMASTLPWGTSMNASVAVPVMVVGRSLTAGDVRMKLVGDSHPGELGEIKVYDDATFRKMVVPSVSSAKWDSWWNEWNYDDGTTSWTWDKSVWPDNIAVVGRYWAVASVMAKPGNVYGLTHLEVLIGGDVWKSITYCNRENAGNLPIDKIFGGATCQVPALTSDKHWVVWPDLNVCDRGLVGQWFDFCTAYDGGKIEVRTKGAGRLVVTYYTDGDVFSFAPTGRNIVNYSTDYSDEWLRQWGEAVQTLTVDVSAATTVTLAYDDWSDMYFEDIAFYPSDAKSVNIRPMFIEDCDYGDNCGFQYLRGYVTGGGVYKAGETATLIAVAGNTAKFDHWDVPDEIAGVVGDLTDPTLSFVVPESICGTMDDQTTVRIHPVWRKPLPGESPLEAEYRFVPGEQVDIDSTLIGYTAKGLPSGLKYDKSTGRITGTLTKPTAVGGVAVTFTKSGEEDVETVIIFGPLPTVSVEMAGVNSDSDIQGCKVTGAKAYLVGARVTLKATAPKGTAFVGWFDGETAVSRQSSYVFTMDKENVVLVAKFEKEVIAVDSGALAEGATFPAGVLGAEGGMKITADAPSGVKSIAVSKLPAGMKFDAKNGNVITGAPTKPGDYTVQVKVTTNSGAVETRDIEVSVAAMPETAVGTFSGFVANGEFRIGTLTLTATDAGKLTAKVLTAAGTVSFSGTCWDSVEDGVYHVTLATKKGDFLTLALDKKAGWDANQLTGTFSPPNMTGWFDVSAQRNAFAQKWYFDATGNANGGWSLSFAQNAKAAALTVTLKADGSTAIAGMLPNGFDGKGKPVSIKVSASGYANVGAVRDGAIRAGFVPVVKVGSEKKALSINTNLWFDRSKDHDEGVGGAELVE